MELAILPVPARSRPRKHSFGGAQGSWGGARGVFQSQAKTSHWGRISLRDVAPHASEFLGLTTLSLQTDWCFSKPCLPGRKAMRQSLKYGRESAKAINSAQLSAQTAPVSPRNHPGLFSASQPSSQFIPSLAPLPGEPQNHHHGMGALEET